MGNEIYAKQNFYEFPFEVKDRIEPFLDFFRTNKNYGTTLDLCCGNCYIGEEVGADEFADLYPIYDSVRPINLMVGPLDMKFDNIIMSHALEHFDNPIQVLRTVSEMLNVGGKLFLAVPNATKGDAVNIYKPYSAEIGHVSFFTIKTLNDTINNVRGLSCSLIKEQNHYKYDAFEIYTMAEKR